MARKKKLEVEYEPSKYQKAIFNFVEKGQGNAVIEAQAGSGKCLGKNTPVMMFDGSIKLVQNIKVGDLLMGDDSKPRKVLSTTIGYGGLRKITPTKGDAWVCNDVHVLTLDHYTGSKKNRIERIDIPIDELEKKNASLHPNKTYRNYKLVRAGIEFPYKKVFFDPWLYGLWLGDGTRTRAEITCADKEIIDEVYRVIPSNYFIKESNDSHKEHVKILTIRAFDTQNNQIRKFLLNNSSINNNKFINKDFLINSREVRLKLLAGLMDSDGSLSKNCFDFVNKSEELVDDVVYLCRSLGFSAYKKKCIKTCTNNGKSGVYYRVTISGDIDEIPTILTRKKAHKRRINKSVLRTGFKIDKIDDGEYYGFTLDGNGRFLLGDFTITHNTSTAIKSISLIPEDKKILLTAFNNSIVDELKKKVKKLPHPENIDCRTMHSLGYLLLLSNYGNAIEKKPNDFKYSSYIYNNISELGGDCYASLQRKEQTKYIDNVKQFVDFGRCYLAETIKDMQFVEDHYSISVFGNEKEVALDVLKWGKENYQTIDFTDMVWLPHVLNCKPLGRIYDWIICDESQDVSVAERELLLRCTKMSTRMLFFGQDIQSIYGFQGADSQSFVELKKLPNTISLPLSISYRCSKNIVRLANRFAPNMEAKEDAVDGEIKYNVPIEEIGDGDMVLCRVNAPLLQLYCELSKLGIPAHICGKDIGTNLIKVIQKTKETELNVSLNKKGVFSKLYNNLFNDIDMTMRKNNISFDMAMDDMNISQSYDTIQALEAISDGCDSVDCLIEKIKALFSDKKVKGVSLSTIHKAKGLEADNVYICCPSLLPAKSAKKAWELKQEANLEYVAYTRAKKKLGFLSEDAFTRYSSNAQQKSSDLQLKKNKVFLLYGDTNRCSVVVPTHKAAQHIISNATKIETKASNAINISNVKQETPQSFSSISLFIKNSKKKVKRRIKI